MFHCVRVIGRARIHQFCCLIKSYLRLPLAMLLPSPPASDQSYSHDYPYNAIDQRARVFFHPRNDMPTQKNERIRLSDFLAGQTLFSHYASLFVAFWNFTYAGSMLDEARNIGSFVIKRHTGRSSLPVQRKDLGGNYASSCFPLATTACMRCCGRTS